MKNRRKLVVALGAGPLAVPFGSFAQQQGKVWRIGVLAAESPSIEILRLEYMRAGLRELGYPRPRAIRCQPIRPNAKPQEESKHDEHNKNPGRVEDLGRGHVFVMRRSSGTNLSREASEGGCPVRRWRRH
jgi:hypothetical protein